MNTKQKVLLGLAGLTALAVAGGSVGTMAWFYSNTTVTASGLSMSVKAPADVISACTTKNGTFSTSLTLTTSCTSMVPVACQVKTADFMGDFDSFCGANSIEDTSDASSLSWAVLWKPKDNNPINASNNASWAFNGGSPNASYWSSVNYDSSKPTGPGNEYIAQTLYLKNSKSTSVKLKMSVTLKNIDTTKNLWKAFGVIMCTPPAIDYTDGSLTERFCAAKFTTLSGTTSTVTTKSDFYVQPWSSTNTSSGASQGVQVMLFLNGESEYCTTSEIQTGALGVDIKIENA